MPGAGFKRFFYFTYGRKFLPIWSVFQAKERLFRKILVLPAGKCTKRTEGTCGGKGGE